MIARRFAVTFAVRASIAILVLGTALAAACDKMPLVAPSQSTINLLAAAASVSPSGSVDIIATVTEQAGTPVQNGTVVSFATTLGHIDPAEARTQNGKVTVKFTADGRSGTATVTAFSGGAERASIDLPVGGAAATLVIVRADPGAIPAGGGSVQIVAQVRDEPGNALSGVPVTFSTTAGALSPGTATTDGNGEARTTLTSTREAVVTAQAGSQSGEVTVPVTSLPTIGLTASPTAPIAGQTVTFTIDVTSTATGNPVRDVRLSFGDGDSVNLGAVNGTTSAAHTYNRPGSYTVTATLTDTAGQSTSQALVVSVADAPPIAVTLSNTPAAPAVNQQVTLTAAVSAPAGTTITGYDWNFGDGKTAHTSGNVTTHVYTSAGVKLVRVSVDGSGGASGSAQTQFVVN